MNTISIEELLKKVERQKEQSGVDLSTAEDLSIAVMDLISLEEHFFFTGVKTGASEYFDTSTEIRSMRKELLGQLMPEHEGETWCISKHLLSAVMRLIEVGTKLNAEGQKEEAKTMFQRAHKIYTIFWALKLKLVSGGAIKDAASSSSQLDDLINKLVDCCNE